jgi:choline dehydrogenase-like flavoprotein
MLIDGHTLPEGSTITADVCVVGAGPAGITLARELSGSGLNVAVLESGGLERDAKTASLKQAGRSGYPYFRLERARERYLGGTSNHWLRSVGLRARPLDAIDFEARSWLPHSGWPFDKAHLDPYYARAHEVCGLGPYDYDPMTWQEPGSREPLSLSDDVATTVFQFGPRDRFIRLGQELAASSGVRFYVHTNVLGIETAEAGHVGRLRLATLQGRRFSATARAYVLAAGGLENPRLLLLSNATQPAGLGNQNDLVGRYFMEHLNVRSAVMRPARPELIHQSGFYRRHPVQSTAITGMLSLSEAALRREQVPNGTFYFLPKHAPRVTESFRSLGALASAARDRFIPPDPIAHLRDLPAATRDVAGLVYRRLRHREPDVFELVTMAEQTPNPASRVTLSDKRDALGLRRLDLDWRFSQIDLDGIVRSQEVVAEALQDAGLGAVEMQIGRGRPFPLIHGQWHHMGTTRMHESPREGVVDATGRVHGVSNLYITGSSVFPTGGYCNPTLTLIALAIRLADELKSSVSNPVDLVT